MTRRYCDIFILRDLHTRLCIDKNRKILVLNYLIDGEVGDPALITLGKFLLINEKRLSS